MQSIILPALLIASSPFRPLLDEAPIVEMKTRPAETNMDKQAPADGDGVAALPFARGERFATLDDYLAHLERQGAVGLPWWREIRPGVYEHVKTVRPMSGAPRETATRAELLQRFGFAR